MKILKHLREKLAYIARARVNHKGWEMGVGYFGWRVMLLGVTSTDRAAMLTVR
jgi:hypothetical protein